MKPWLGTAEIRHTPPLPKRTVALPPWEEMVCTPEPPSAQPASVPSGPAPCVTGGGAGVVVRAAGEGLAVRGSAVVRVGAGPGRCEGEGLGSGDGEGEGDTEAAGDAAKPSGADRATGAVGLVEPTTKWTVSMTAVTLAAVHDSQMSR
ncbi:hypothetical protein EAO77_16490 [Streptomyces sp. t39]|nr:hypothetical protein EAO77_16490 [Streptomyces sp. t39]